MASAHQHYYTEANRVMARPAALLDGQGGFSVHGSSGFVRSVVGGTPVIRGCSRSCSTQQRYPLTRRLWSYVIDKDMANQNLLFEPIWSAQHGVRARCSLALHLDGLRDTLFP